MLYEVGWDRLIRGLVLARASAAAYLGVPFGELRAIARLAAVEAEQTWRKDGGRSLPSWVYQQVHFALGHHLRWMGTRVTESWEDNVVESDEPELDTVVLVRQALGYLQAELPRPEWTLLWMRHAEGLKPSEIAELCGYTSAATEKRLGRAKANAVRVLVAHGIGESGTTDG